MSTDPASIEPLVVSAYQRAWEAKHAEQFSQMEHDAQFKFTVGEKTRAGLAAAFDVQRKLDVHVYGATAEDIVLLIGDMVNEKLALWPEVEKDLEFVALGTFLESLQEVLFAARATTPRYEYTTQGRYYQSRESYVRAGYNFGNNTKRRSVGPWEPVDENGDPK